MTKYIILLGAICTMAFSGCYKEDPITAELEKYWRDYDVNSTDPAFKYVSEYWQKYDKVLLYDAEIRDYLYNFQQKNDVEIVNSTDKIYEKIQLLEKLFLKQYNDDVKDTVFPFNVILAEKVIYTGGWSPQEKDYLGSRNFVAFKITDADLALDAAALKKKSIAMHKSFILDYCIVQEKASLKKFGSVSTYGSAGYYWAKIDLTYGYTTMAPAYERGFFYVQAWEDSYEPEFPETPWRHSFRGDVNGDASDYFDQLMKLSDEELAALRAQWPAIDRKMGYFIEMLESLHIDYKQLK